MGVPQFFHWLFTHYSQEILYEQYSGGTPPEYLYLDFNCGIHPAVKQPHLKDLPSMYQAVIDYLRSIVQQVKPTKMVYITIDGVAPNAKMKQQRSRRFKAVQDKRERDKIDRKHKCWQPSEFDFNMISPGTQFMVELSDQLNQYLATNWSVEFGDLQVILDDASYPGEGEHKIMHHLRTQLPTDSRAVIYGLDSDLIFLCLLNYRPGLCLFREKINFGQQPVDKTKLSNLDPSTGANEFTYLDVGELRKIILTLLDPSLSQEDIVNWGVLRPKRERQRADLDFRISLDDQLTPKEKTQAQTDGVEELKKRYLALNLTETDGHKLIQDYVATTFILGNDFLPHIPSLKIKEGGLNRVIEAYKEVQSEMPNQYLVTENGQNFNFLFFYKFLQKLAMTEDADFLNQGQTAELRQSKFKTSYHYRTASPYLRNIKEWEYIENQYRDTLKLGYEGWRQRYYEHYFGDFNTNRVQQVVQNYLEGLVWMLRYYSGNGVDRIDNDAINTNLGQPAETCASWDWIYHYRNAPSLTCLLGVLSASSLEKIQFQIGQPVSCWEQLLVILPPQSHKLLPPILGRLMINVDSPLIHLYPTDFKIDLMGHRYRWECYPMLPEIDLEVIRKTLSVIREGEGLD